MRQKTDVSFLPFFMTDFEKFSRFLVTEKRMSEHTIIAYQGDLAQFLDYLSVQYEVNDLREVTTAQVRSWFASLRERAVSAKSVHRKRSTLSTFYKFARSQGWVESDPVRKTTAPKIEKRLPQFVDEKGMQRLLEHELDSNDTFTDLRDEVILTLLYECGMRLAELIGLRLTDLDTYKKSINVIGKRNKERQIPLSDNTVALLEKYIEKREHVAEGQCSALLCTDQGRKLYPKFVYLKVNHYLGRVSTLEKRSPHILRHTFATHMLNNGAQLNSVKELLGHASLAATQVYTHNTIEKLKAIHERSHPKG